MTAKAATLRLAAVPRVDLLTDVVLVTLGAALIAASAQVSIPLPFTPVPITGQTFAVLLVGASLGTVRGGSSALLYVLIGIAGAPRLRVRRRRPRLGPDHGRQRRLPRRLRPRRLPHRPPST